MKEPNYECNPILPDLADNDKFVFDEKQLQQLSTGDQQLFEKFAQGPMQDLPFLCLHHAFEARAREMPQAIAAKYAGQSISYQQLNQQADYLASRLRAEGVRNGDHVALFVRRSIPMLVGMLAILKAGAAYVPQDIKLSSTEQLQHIIAQAETRVILTLAEYIDKCPLPKGHVRFVIDDLMAEAEQKISDQIAMLLPRKPIPPGQTCFLLFTSGTTGKPNGVKVTHQNVCNIVLTRPGNLAIQPGMQVGQLLNIAFDMSAWEIWSCLSFGGTLLIRDDSIQQTAEQCDVIIATPSILSSLDADRCQRVKVVAVAGEPCPRPLADRWSVFCHFYNSCGPTETTIVNTASQHHPDKKQLTIGTPTPNNTVYILDEHLQALAIGEVGEMWAGGDCVSAGYLKNSALNNERYRDDPFLGNGRKMFRTRDLGRWTETGELLHLGRTDDQVKIRGFRVELDSVSRVLESAESCLQAVTLKWDNRNLVAFVTPDNVDKQNLRKTLQAQLPYYCEPQLLVPLSELPRTARGKLDKQQLLATASLLIEQQGETLQKEME
ncbi:MAG: amino acid adenylation domain-containing protein [Gammaproteobacteria bacterium]|nr:amino acid adenylation domain-containing protein [Gammaproteobacteria bacterium]